MCFAFLDYHFVVCFVKSVSSLKTRVTCLNILILHRDKSLEAFFPPLLS